MWNHKMSKMVLMPPEVTSEILKFSDPSFFRVFFSLNGVPESNDNTLHFYVIFFTIYKNIT